MSEPILVGYFPKRRVLRPDWLGAPGVEEVCSVSDCIASGPGDWIHHWRHNVMGFFDSPELAWSIVPAEERGEFILYGYELFPWCFQAGRRVAYILESMNATPMTPDFKPLGFDVVSRAGGFFECSPLSCNSWAQDVGANAFCLVDDLEEADRLASIAEAEACEPGDYYVLSVWRRGPDERAAERVLAL